MKSADCEIEIQFTEPLLGSASNNKEVHREFIAAKAPRQEASAEEVEAIPDLEDEMAKATTVFPSDGDGLFLWDYQVRGFLKEAIGVLVELGDIKELSKWQFKKAVDSFVFVTPRRIYLADEKGKRHVRTETFPERFTRPLRADTMRGERVALATSEVLPALTRARFTITLLSGDNKKSRVATIKEEHIRAALNYGALKGLGQWRSGGHGRFSWKELPNAK